MDIAGQLEAIRTAYQDAVREAGELQTRLLTTHRQFEEVNRTIATEQDQRPVVPPASGPTVDLPTQADFLASLQVPPECPVCYNDINAPYQTACKHVFCLECAKTWFETSNTCPTCRTVVYEKQEVEEEVEVDEEEGEPSRLEFAEFYIAGLFSETLISHFFSTGWRTLQSVVEYANDLITPRFIPLEAEEVAIILDGMPTYTIQLINDKVFAMPLPAGTFHYALERFIDESWPSRREFSVRYVMLEVNRIHRGWGLGASLDPGQRLRYLWEASRAVEWRLTMARATSVKQPDGPGIPVRQIGDYEVRVRLITPAIGR